MSKVENYKEHYVYILVDDRNKHIFYVGKGVGNRGNQHEVEASTNKADTEKLNKINEIKNAGDKVLVRIIGRYDTKEEAFAVESTLIHWVYGIEKLTNMQSGHGGDLIRPHGNYNEIVIDKGLNNLEPGYHSDRFRNKRDVYDIYKVMSDVKKYLEEELNVVFSDINESMATETSISYDIDKKVKIVIGMGHSSSKKIFIQVLPNQEKKENKFILKLICDATIFELKNNGKYARIKDFKSTKDREMIKENFIEYKKLLTQALKNLE